MEHDPTSRLRVSSCSVANLKTIKKNHLYVDALSEIGIGNEKEHG